MKQPRHPYTQLLMQALPRNTKKQGRLQIIDGTVPRITEKKPECRFANRCPYAEARCSCENPPLVQIDAGHSVRCFRAAAQDPGKEARHE